MSAAGPPPASPPALALAAALLFAAGCGQRAPESCPGSHLATMRLQAVLASTGCVVAPDGWAARIPPRIPAAEGSTFAVEWTVTPGGQVAYCTGADHAVPLTGDRQGSQVHVARTLDGAVLDLPAQGAGGVGCPATCTPRATIAVDGDLTGDPPAAFSGTLTETYDQSRGDCGGCVLPCFVTYTLTGGST